MIWTVTHVSMGLPLSVTVEATSKENAIWEAFRRVAIRDWCLFRRLVREVARLH